MCHSERDPADVVVAMSQTVGSNNNRVYRVVLCGGPCGGKTTGQARLRTFFESIGWKVFRVTASESIMASGGVKAADSRNTDKTLAKFYENILVMKMQLEKSYFDLAAMSKSDCLIICDGGTMDIKARMSPEQWKQILADNDWNEVDLRDSRYNQVVHMVSTADASTGRRRHFSSHEGMDIATARQLDLAVSQAWIGHPYYDVIDNSTGFDRKLVRMIAAVCDRLDIEYGDRLSTDSYKRKFFINRLPDVSVFPKFQDFAMVHDYLVTPNQKMQARIDRRGQNGNWTYTHTVRCPLKHSPLGPELKMQVTARKYQLLLAQKDSAHYTVNTTRRCFLWNNQYFQLDVYEEPCPPRIKGLILLETYTSNRAEDFELPPFLEVRCEVTGDLDYSMFNLSKKRDPEPSLSVTLHGDYTNGRPAETDVERSDTLELDGTADHGALSAPATSDPDTTADLPETLVKSASDLNTSVADSVPHGRKNGYHCDIVRDQVAGISLSKLDISHGSSAVIGGSLSENGHISLDDYERFAKWCCSGKSGAAVK